MAGDVLVVSPHCDDAVFSCGDFLATHAGAVVVTVFAGRPAAGTPLTPWDAAAGFSAADDVMTVRRQEDRAALAILRATPLWLEFRDAQYATSPPPEAIAPALAAVVARLRPRTIVLPLGLFHSDHELAHRATLPLADPAAPRTVLWYEDAIYRRLPGVVRARLRQMGHRGLSVRRAAPARAGSATARKRWAVRCYGSQLRALGSSGRPGVGDAFAEEALWRLIR